ncbi:uncharacterized protein LOC141853809 [Brevipalpus obovatus]|uniref:uncharacterized protein LOC141853809 n=1 Tax=Brevipalpus obovatus TaxID=246614 RepID=UPI003D9E9402
MFLKHCVEFPHLLSAKSLRTLTLCLVLLCVTSYSVNAKVSKKGNKKIFRKNSPIYYVSNIKPIQSIFSNAFDTYNAINTAYNAYNSIASTLNYDFKKEIIKVHKPTTVNSFDSKRKNSQIYNIPLRFMSNAKPIDIITGLGDGLSKKNKRKRKPSKVTYINTKYLSNAKPNKLSILNGSKWKI